MRHLRPLLVALSATVRPSLPAALCAVAFPLLQAQSPSGLSGTVVATDGSPIAGAEVALVSPAGVLLVSTNSDAGGHFALTSAAPSGSGLRITASGFQTFTAQAAQASGQVFTLHIAPAETTIVVTPTRSARPLSDVPASVTVVSAEQLQHTPARTVDDVLRRVPSVDLPIAGTNEQHPTDTIVSMRGLSGIRSLVLLDGVPLNDPFFGFIQWSEVPLATVDRIEVVRGGGATLWGNDAMGGVINILTKPVARPELTVESAGGSRGTYRTDTHAALAARSFGLGLDAGESHSNGYLEQALESRGPIDVPTSFTAATLALSGNADLAPSLTAHGRVSHYSNAQNYLTHLQTNGEGTWRYAGALNWRPTERQAVDLTLFHNAERFTTNNTGAPDGADPADAEYIQNVHRTLASDLGVSALWSHTFSGALRTLSAGGDFHGLSGSDAAQILTQEKAYLRTDLGSGQQRFAGGFVQADLRPLERLQLLVSLRYQGFWSFHGVDDTPGGLGAAVPSRHNDALDPRLSVRYQLPAGFALRGAAYRAFRAPTLDNLYRSASVPGYILYGNAALSPETLNGGEAGFDLTRGPVRLQATGYISQIAHLLTYRYLDPSTLPAGFTTGARLINAARARSRGFEAELNWELSRHLNALLGYTYADSVVTANPEDPASVGVQQPGIPKNRATLGLSWNTVRGLELSPHLRYLSRTSGDPDNLFHTDPHFVADLSVTAPVTHRLRAFVQLENLLDRTYIGTNDGFSAPLYGRPFTATAGLRLAVR